MFSRPRFGLGAAMSVLAAGLAVVISPAMEADLHGRTYVGHSGPARAPRLKPKRVRRVRSQMQTRRKARNAAKRRHA